MKFTVARRLALSDARQAGRLPEVKACDVVNARDSKTRADSSPASRALLSPEFGIYSLGSRAGHSLDYTSFEVGVVICHA